MKEYTFSMFGKVLETISAKSQHEAEIEFIKRRPDYDGFTAKVQVKN